MAAANCASMEAAAEGWLIAQLRGLPRRRRLEEHLLDRRLRGLDVRELADHLERLEAEVAELTAQLAERAEPQGPPGHVLFFATPDGWEAVEAAESPPPVGQLLMLEGRWFRVQRVGRSPFPRDRRPCVFLEVVPAFE